MGSKKELSEVGHTVEGQDFDPGVFDLEGGLVGDDVPLEVGDL